jgi:putative hemolysin
MNRIADPHQRGALFSLDEFARRLPVKPPNWLIEPFLNLTGLSALELAYRRFPTETTGNNPFRRALDCLRIRTIVDVNTKTRIPENGPTILLANHPFGGADGLTLGALALERRKDVRILVNAWLSELSMLAPFLIPVNVFEAKKNVLCNVGQLRAALRHLQDDGLLIVFPAGTVSQFNPLSGKTEDPLWSNCAAKLARHSNATVVPIYFPGSNRSVFHVAGFIHPTLRTALLPSELVSKQDSAIHVTIGPPISASSYNRFATDEERTAWFRLRTYSLELPNQTSRPQPKLPPVSKSVPPAVIKHELLQLPESNLLLTQGPFQVYLFEHKRAPRTIDEIGRLREISFRAVGEGTGKSSDLDQFDLEYQHLLLWDSASDSIVGSYRIAFCDLLIKSKGASGLYTNTLFRYKKTTLNALSDCIELGRSFITPAYQKRPLPLALLWRGIGEVLCRNPNYRRLLGPVSISSRYCGNAQRLLLTYLGEMKKRKGHLKEVDPRNPVIIRQNSLERLLCSQSTFSPKTLSTLISELDFEGKKLPVLLERYLELGAEIIELNRDPNFSNCIDALVLVTLDRTPENILKRFMGTEGAVRFTRQLKFAS